MVAGTKIALLFDTENVSMIEKTIQKIRNTPKPPYCLKSLMPYCPENT